MHACQGTWDWGYNVIKFALGHWSFPRFPEVLWHIWATWDMRWGVGMMVPGDTRLGMVGWMGMALNKFSLRKFALSLWWRLACLEWASSQENLWVGPTASRLGSKGL